MGFLCRLKVLGSITRNTTDLITCKATNSAKPPREKMRTSEDGSFISEKYFEGLALCKKRTKAKKPMTDPTAQDNFTCLNFNHVLATIMSTIINYDTIRIWNRNSKTAH